MAPDETPPPAGASIRGVIRSGSLAIDVPARKATVGDRQLDLKPKEFDLLVYLARHPGVVISRNALLREVWGYDYPVDTRTIDVHVRGVRQELEADGVGTGMIETVRGYGYRFAGQVSRG
jgi:DNA-binding response OmpR family regulator